VSFIREAHDWELDVFVSFFQALHSIKERQGGEDKLWWISSKRGLFTIKALFHSLGSAVERRFPWKSVADASPSESGLFCLVSGAGQNSDLG
jgi:hypothetical protein